MANPKLVEFFQKKAEQNSCTPDIAHLTRHYSAVPVFVYGTHQNGYSEHWWFKTFQRVGVGITNRATYNMYLNKSTVGTSTPPMEWKEPIVFHMPSLVAETGKIMGEIYLVPVSRLPEVDNLMNNTVWTQRKLEHIRFTVHKSNRKVEEYLTECFMYVGEAEQWKKEIAGRKMVRQFRYNGAIGPYYHFQSTDDANNRVIARQWEERAKTRLKEKVAAEAETERRVVM